MDVPLAIVYDARSFVNPHGNYSGDKVCECEPPSLLF
jgi:hypothetical protein